VGSVILAVLFSGLCLVMIAPSCWSLRNKVLHCVLSYFGYDWMPKDCSVNYI
jgi:hypothetical protein